MDNSAASPNDAPPQPGSLSHWLAGHPGLVSSFGGALLKLVEPQNSYVTVKSLATGRYVYASEGIGHWFDRKPVVGANDSELVRSEEAIAMRRIEQTVMAQGQMLLSEHRLELGGRRREFTVTRMPLGGEHLLAVWHERTEERQREAHLQRALQQIEAQQQALEQARREAQRGTGRDDASGLYLRGQFDDQLLREIDLSTREHREFALVIIALDPAPAAAQALGDDGRQRMLEGVGRMLRANTRAMDAACRIGESRFAVLLSGVGLATAHARMEQLRRQCQAQIVVLNGMDLGLSLSMGVCSFPHTASKQEDLLAASELAVAEALKRGGNQVVLASIPFSD
ncbi:GGDEF domain-containing protein [Pelomonas sp. KK5]|uniref:GGDEF domain-containing protein n=1 Tax=Pelomonas sp. KK5 TaxID=1855730 RepID=UPI0009FA3122|nr:GGDEF domain-containing protein [Pelomonas sp. KK5]